MKDWSDKRPAQIMQRMAATVSSVPYEVLAEFGHNYNRTLLTLVIYLRITSASGFEVADYDSAHDFLLEICWMSCGASTSIILICKRPSRRSNSSSNPRDGPPVDGEPDVRAL